MVRMPISSRARFGVVFASGLFALAHLPACGDDDPPPAENVGTACASAAECYPGLQEAGTLKGAVQCLTRVPNGYCTHLCQADTDCCAVAGECPGGRAQVCGPFESTGQQMCFLSCEAADVSRAGETDPNVYCQKYANAAFNCRSTGGGAKNRKVCVQ